MEVTAAVVHERSGPFAIERLEPYGPRPDELLVEVVAGGMRQIDLHGHDGYCSTPYPTVFGHEGAGIVRALGSSVRTFAPRDHA